MMTVSRVINHHDSVKPNTKKRVEKAMKTLGYQPNLAAQRLSSGKNGLIGVVCYESNSAYVSQFIYGCVRRISSLGLHLVIEEFDHEKPLGPQMQTLCERVQGVIILPPMHEIKDIMQIAEQYNLPTALIGCDLDFDSSLNFLSLHIEDEKASRLLTRHLIGEGHTRIGFITGDKKQKVSGQRLLGYTNALKKASIPYNPQFVEEGDFSYRSALLAAENLIALNPRPTAIVASNDDMAAAVIAIANKHQLRVPEDLSLVGFDDINTATLVWPQLTTIFQPLQDMAINALEFVTNQRGAKRQTLAFKMIERESTAPPLI